MASNSGAKGKEKDYDSVGPLRQARTKRLLKALLHGADPLMGEELQAELLSHRPKQLKLNEDGRGFTLVFEAEKFGRDCLSRLAKLVELTEGELPRLSAKDKKKYQEHFTVDHVTESLEYLERYLKILTHIEERKRGVARYRFGINLWARDIEQNLRRFDQLWQSQRGQSKDSPELDQTISTPDEIAFHPPGDHFQPGETKTVSADEVVQQLRNRIHDDIHRLHSKMPLWGVDYWVPIGDLFVDVNILENVSSNLRLELDDLWKDFNKSPSNRSFDRIGLSEKQKRMPGLEILDKRTNLMILGKPGSGKTTFLQHLAINCIKRNFFPPIRSRINTPLNNQNLRYRPNSGVINLDGKFTNSQFRSPINLGTHWGGIENSKPTRVPALIKLREFIEDGREISYSLHKYLERYWQLSEVEIHSILSKGRAIIMLDGLDEVTGEDGKNIARKIKQFARDYPQVQTVVTCRTQSQESRFDRFDYVEIADFNELQIRTFSERWFKAVTKDDSKGQEKAKEFLGSLFREENKLMRDLLVTPILLSLACAVFHHTGKFYTRRSKLYKEGLELLLETWDKSREIERGEIYRGLTARRKMELLIYLAVKKFERDQYILFEDSEIRQYISEFLNIHESDSVVVLKAIESQHGLLIERAKGIWSFSHLTFQEFLAAEFYACDEDNFNQTGKKITQGKYNNMLMILVEILKSSNSILQAAQQEIENVFLSEILEVKVEPSSKSQGRSPTTLKSEPHELQKAFRLIDRNARVEVSHFTLAAMRSFYFLPATFPTLEREDIESIYRYFCEISVVELLIDPLLHSILFFSRDIKKIFLDIFLNFFDEDFVRKEHNFMNLWVVWGNENWIENQKVFRKLEISMPEELRRIWMRTAEEFQADLALLRGRYESHIEHRNKLLSEKALTEEIDTEFGKAMAEGSDIFMRFESHFESYIKLAKLIFAKDSKAAKRLEYISENSPSLLIKRVLHYEKSQSQDDGENRWNQDLSHNHYHAENLKRIINESLLPWINGAGSHWFQELECFATQYSPHGLDWENITFISQKRSAFAKYLRLNGLLIDCLKSSAEVSNEVELLIEKRLLWPFGDSSLLTGGSAMPLPALALCTETIVGKLKQVPVFIILKSDGQPLTAPAEVDSQDVKVPVVFINGSTVQDFLTRARQEDPNAEVALVSLGTLYQETVLSDENKVPLLYLPIGDELDAALEIQPNFQGVPLFIARQGAEGPYLTINQDGEASLPLFFSRDDLQTLLDRYEETNAGSADNIVVQVMSLEWLLATMTNSTDPALNAQLEQVRLFPSAEVLKYIREQHPGSPPTPTEPTTP